MIVDAPSFSSSKLSVQLVGPSSSPSAPNMLSARPQHSKTLHMEHPAEENGGEALLEAPQEARSEAIPLAEEALVGEPQILLQAEVHCSVLELLDKILAFRNSVTLWC